MRASAGGLALAVLLHVCTAWNIGGRSPVTDLKSADIVKVATFALADAEAVKMLDLPDSGGTNFKLDQSCCKGCACILKATKQVVAGWNWDLVLKFVPRSDGAAEEYRKVSVFDQTFKKGEGDKLSVTSVEKIDKSAASRNDYTQVAIDSLSDSNAESHVKSAQSKPATPENSYLKKLAQRTTGLVQEVISKPASCDSGRKVQDGDLVSVHYTGTLTNGQKFDSSYDRKQPFQFKVGAGSVIKGWEQTLPGMCIGEKLRVHIPAALGYGSRGFRDLIPPNSNLVFEIQLQSIDS